MPSTTHLAHVDVFHVPLQKHHFWSSSDSELCKNKDVMSAHQSELSKN